MTAGKVTTNLMKLISRAVPGLPNQDEDGPVGTDKLDEEEAEAADIV